MNVPDAPNDQIRSRARSGGLPGRLAHYVAAKVAQPRRFVGARLPSSVGVALAVLAGSVTPR